MERGYRDPAPHRCDHSLVCGAPTQERDRLCRNPRSEPDGRCYLHTTSRVYRTRRVRVPGGALIVSVRGDEAEALRRAARAAGVSPARMVELLVRNRLMLLPPPSPPERAS
jgi:hypothetical protein